MSNSQKPLISLLHPTARVVPSEAFPRGWRAAHDAWLARADHPERIEYVLAVHSSRFPDALADVMGDASAWREFRCVQNFGRDCIVDQINAAFAASHGLVIVGVQDDLYPPEHWDTLILEALPCLYDSRSQRFQFFDKHEVVMVFDSGTPGNTPERERELMMCNATTREVIERRGYCLDPDFESMYADNWWAFENRRDEKAGLLTIIERLDIRFEHRRAKHDLVYEIQNRPEAYLQGRATYLKKAHGTRTLSLCFPGEFFYWKCMASMLNLLAHLNQGYRFLLSPWWGYSSNIHDIRVAMAEQVLKHAYPSDLVYWSDDDNQITPEQFDLLVQDLDDHPELDGVVGCCWCDNDGEPDPETGLPKPWMMSFGRQGPNFECKRMEQEDYIKAVESGTMLITSDDVAPDAFWSGFPIVLLRGSVLERLGARAFLPILHPDVRNGIVSEDASFFYRAHKAGMKFGVDLRVHVPHLKIRAIAPQFIPLSQKDEARRVQGFIPDRVLESVV